MLSWVRRWPSRSLCINSKAIFVSLWLSTRGIVIGMEEIKQWMFQSISPFPCLDLKMEYIWSISRPKSGITSYPDGPQVNLEDCLLSAEPLSNGFLSWRPFPFWLYLASLGFHQGQPFKSGYIHLELFSTRPSFPNKLVQYKH